MEEEKGLDLASEQPHLKLPSCSVTKANRIRIQAFSLEHVAHPATHPAVHYKFRVWGKSCDYLGKNSMIL